MGMIHTALKTLLLLFILSFGMCQKAFSQQDTSKVYEWNGGLIRFHTVEKGKTLYSISKMFQVKQEDILLMNPSAENGLKTGMVLRIPVAASKSDKAPEKEQPKSSQQHTVKAKETAFGIAKMYGLTVAELEAMNPEIQQGLKPGMQLYVYPASVKKPEDPKKTAELMSDRRSKSNEGNPVKEESVSCSVLSKEQQNRPFQISILLPFFLPSGEELNPKARIGLDFYSGAKLALDSLKKLGYQITVHVFDSQNDSTSVDDFLKNPALAKSDLIIGPLYSSAFIRVAEFAKSKNIPAVSPFSQSDALLTSYPNVIKVIPDLLSQIQQSGPALKKLHPNARYTLIRNSNEKDKELADAFKSSLLVSAAISPDDFQEITYSSMSDLLEKLSEANENVILFPSTVQVQVIDFVGRLSAARTGKRITLVGLNDWNNYENIEFDHLNNLNFTCAAPSSTNHSSGAARLFQSRFKEEFKGEPTFYAYQGFDVTFYFCKQIASYGKSFLKCLPEVPLVCGINSCYRYSRIGENDGYENQFIYLLEMDNFELKRRNQP